MARRRLYPDYTTYTPAHTESDALCCDDANPVAENTHAHTVSTALCCDAANIQWLKDNPVSGYRLLDEKN